MTGLLRVFYSLVFLAVVATAGYPTLHATTAIGAPQNIEASGITLGLIPEGDRSCPGAPAACATTLATRKIVASATGPTLPATSRLRRRLASPDGRPRGRLPDPADDH